MTTIDGAVSGIDTSALIRAIIDASSGPKRAVESRVKQYETKNTKITELLSKVKTLQSSLEDIEDIKDFAAYKAIHNETDAFTVELDGDAVAGSYAIEVVSLAKSEMEISQGYASASTDGALGTGTLSVTYGGTTTNLSVTSDMSLADVAAALDDVDGIRAYVLNTGTGANPYRLVVQGEDAGADYTISMDASGLSGGTAPTFTEQVAASSAEITVNGVTITSDTNSVDGAIPGMTLDLAGLTTAAVTVNVEPDHDAVVAKVQSFVDAFNDVARFVKVQSVYDAEAGIKGAFVGEASVSRVMQGLKSVITTEFTGLGQDWDAISFAGVSFTSEGLLELDASTLEDALDDDPDAVNALFTDEDGFVQAMLDKIDLYNDRVEGSLVLRQDSIEERISDMEEQVEVYERRLSKMEIRLRNQYAAMESLLGNLQSAQNSLLASLGTTV